MDVDDDDPGAAIITVEANGEVCAYETVCTSLGSELEVLSDYVCESSKESVSRLKLLHLILTVFLPILRGLGIKLILILLISAVLKRCLIIRLKPLLRNLVRLLNILLYVLVP